MKDIMTAPFVREMCETTANMYRLGWDERNGGNISYLPTSASSASAKAGRTSNFCGATRTAAGPPPNSPRT